MSLVTPDGIPLAPTDFIVPKGWEDLAPLTDEEVVRLGVMGQSVFAQLAMATRHQAFMMLQSPAHMDVLTFLRLARRWISLDKPVTSALEEEK